MAYSYNIEEIPPDDVPCVEHDIRRAKKFLQKYSPESGDSLYDHLTEVIAKILAERPRNAVDIFEEYSKKVKEERFKTQTDHLRDLYVPPAQYDEAKKLIKLFTSAKHAKEAEQEKLDDEEENESLKKKPNMMDLLFYFEQTNVGLPRREMVLLNLTIRKLMSDAPIGNVRFWGKILGNPKSYYVVEAEWLEGELNRRLEQIAAEEEMKRKEEEERQRKEEEERQRKEEEERQRKEEERQRNEEKTKAEEAEKPAGEALETAEKEDAPETATKLPDAEKEEEVLNLVFPPMPVNLWKPPPEVPPERIGTGANTKVYFVCNEPGLDEWIELPPVTPQQIVNARQIVRYCTGNLDAPIYTFPPFPGTERNYLRAQIARISAATQVSPIGFFSFGGEGEEEEIGEEIGEEGQLMENVHYDPLPIKDLIDPSMANWCHHMPYILKQGRIVWWNPKKEERDEEIEEEEELVEEEEEIEATDIGKEIGPPILTPISEDAIFDSIIPWTAIQSSYVQPDLAVALVRSNIWPGAFAFACGKRFANVYIGWGHKYTAYNYSPTSMAPVQDQYKIGPEVMEIQDPTFEQEEAYRISRLPPEPVLPMGEEEEVEEEEEEEDDDEEDE